MPASLRRVAEAWPLLPPHVREAILTLVDAAGVCCRTATGRSGASTDDTARQAAIECRQIVQACLREEEWQDADEEFYNVILRALFDQ
ncbi:MAG TPA: hypothetical protein PKC18_07580 [Lacipirellulaceae bacterium]|nr:hypothetical protein [Lacipirellulaceae bacterium]HMP05450.1 hypothetical protein [Lacipirellulaceae bacterium]